MIKVSIVCNVYNHENYIKDYLEGGNTKKQFQACSTCS